MTDSTTALSGDVVARADFQYRWRVYALFLLLFGWGCYSLLDGFVRWPRQNEAWEQMIAEGKKPPRAPHSDNDIFLNQAMGVTCPVIAVALLAWLMYRSRGEYRLSGQTLHVPGHPPVPLERIKTLDKSRWDRKGVAAVEYDLRDGQTAVLSLRDMVYQRAATDRIVQEIESHLAPPAPEPAAPAADSAPQ